MQGSRHDPIEAGERRELDRLLAKYETALLTTRGREGHYHTRPMAMYRPDSGDLWFVTWMDTQKCEDLEDEPRCAVTLHNGGNDPTYVSLSGTGEIVDDRETLRRFWQPGWSAWFPGPDDPEVVLIRFRPEHVEYVHPTAGRLQVLFSMARTLVTRKPSEPAPKKTLELRT